MLVMKNTVKNKLLAFLSLSVAFSLLFSLCIAAKGDGYGWFIRREKEHKPPKIDGGLAWIEKYDAYYLDSDVREGDKVLYLTFDVGYENGNVAKVLDILKKEEVTGAFFVLSNVIQREEALIKRMADEGHLVCNHTSHHKDNTRIDEDTLKQEIRGLEEEYTALTGHALARYYRPPEGRFTEKSLQTVQALGYKTVFWSFAYADWDNHHQPSAAYAKEKVLSNTHNGAVILLHPTSAVNAEILEELIQVWKSQGYRFGTLHELTKTTR